MFTTLRLVKWLLLIGMAAFGIVTDNSLYLVLVWGVSLLALVLLEEATRLHRRRYEITIKVDGEEITLLTRRYISPDVTFVKGQAGSHVRFLAVESGPQVKAYLEKEDHHPNPVIRKGEITYRGTTHTVAIKRCIDRCPCDSQDPHWVGWFYWGHFALESEKAHVFAKFSFFVGQLVGTKEKLIRAYPNCSLEEEKHVIVSEPVYRQIPQRKAQP